VEVSGQLHTPAVLLGKDPAYPLDRMLGGLQCQSGRGGEEEKNFFHFRKLKHDRPAHSLVIIQTELS